VGWALFALTLVANMASWLLSDWFASRARTVRFLKTVAAMLLLGLTAIGGYTIWKWLKP
jgi:hypothetical protein